MKNDIGKIYLSLKELSGNFDTINIPDINGFQVREEDLLVVGGIMNKSYSLEEVISIFRKYNVAEHPILNSTDGMATIDGVLTNVYTAKDEFRDMMNYEPVKSNTKETLSETKRLLDLNILEDKIPGVYRKEFSCNDFFKECIVFDIEEEGVFEVALESDKIYLYFYFWS